MILEFILFQLRKPLQSFFSSSLQQPNKEKKNNGQKKKLERVLL
jgi:hypothetical protein